MVTDLGGIPPTLAVFGGSGFPHPCRVAYSFRFPLYFRACPFHHPFMRDTLKRNINH
ncbi:hypothetical protein NXX71_23135 [Bacteroides faecis]|nr:hypothetical protein [Bacteroides faecis]